MRFAAAALVLLSVTWCSQQARHQSASSTGQRSYSAPRINEPPTIDGRLDDEAWSTAPWSEDFVDIRGEGHPTPEFRTRVKMLWGDRGLYIGAELEEPHVWATLTERDSVIFHDPDFELFVDPDFDGLRYYELEINALGTEWDLLLPRRYTEGGEADHDWTMVGLRTAVHVDGTINDPADTDRGWSVEIELPWSAVEQAVPSAGSSWRINFSRVEWSVHVEDGRYVKDPAPPDEPHPEENWVWSPQGLIDMHQPETWGRVVFLDPP
ncbi:MAG: hypothetical protein GTN89_02730 [Acidobacteria bacterium]|nr:hypothetical protein [Acidobacteriota bacterium]NIM62477.1 hypothetical protein [Acidobacteriota bacterium]NIO59035.1 hypothetical protein [Acidobacteriota bacterium]NIQ29300.1 hypothetical protein [Acidobacteriota bacterium]NIQ86443.1 hypothetical protein [Acidobacteriota bacterium]